MTLDHKPDLALGQIDGKSCCVASADPGESVRVAPAGQGEVFCCTEARREQNLEPRTEPPRSDQNLEQNLHAANKQTLHLVLHPSTLDLEPSTSHLVPHSSTHELEPRTSLLVPHPSTLDLEPRTSLLVPHPSTLNLEFSSSLEL